MDGAVIWVLLRCALYVLGALMNGALGPPPVEVGAPVALSVATGCGALVLLDVMRRREGILLANLGVPLRFAFLLGAVPAVVAELALRMLSSLGG